MLPAIDLDEYFIDVEGVSVTAMAPLQSSGVQRTKFDAPQANRLPSDDDPAFSQQILDISVAQIEAIVEPDGVGDDIGRESVSFIGIHPEIVSQAELTWQYRCDQYF
jgi:hypothetical protein